MPNTNDLPTFSTGTASLRFPLWNQRPEQRTRAESDYSQVEGGDRPRAGVPMYGPPEMKSLLIEMSGTSRRIRSTSSKYASRV